MGNNRDWFYFMILKIKMKDNIIGSFLEWAYNHSDSKHKKYSTYEHGTFVTLTGTLFIVTVTWISSLWIF